MRILVVGGAGYVGSTSVETFVKAGHHVTVYDNLTTGHRAARRQARITGPAARYGSGSCGARPSTSMSASAAWSSSTRAARPSAISVRTLMSGNRPAASPTDLRSASRAAPQLPAEVLGAGTA